MTEGTIRYGRRIDDVMPGNNELAEVFNNLPESQKIHIQMLQSITSINTALNDLQHTVKVHDEILVTGIKGSPSIQERIRNIEKYIENLQYWGRFVGGALVVQTIAFFVGIIIALVRFLPLLEKLAQKP